MRVVLDTNILVSALLSPGRISDLVYQAWRTGRFNLLCSEEQLEEFRRVTRYPKLRPFIEPSAAGTMLNELRQLASIIEKLPHVDVSPDAADNFLLAIAAAGKADYLVTGDKRDILKLHQYKQTKIISIRQFADILK